MAQVALKQHYISAEEYLEGERLSDTKYELIHGEVYAMAGVSKNHERISVNILSSLINRLNQSPCEPFGSDIKVKAGENFYYPDVTVVCNDEGDSDYFTESPIIIVEVLSKSTRQNDRTIKKYDYLKIPTLQEYVLIEQDLVEVEVFRKKNNWHPDYYYLEDEITLESIGITLSVEAIYHRVQNDDMRAFVAKKEQEVLENGHSRN
jgi:Uma2 family endonuclease